MIRIETDSGWILVEHLEHARLAGRFAVHWGNEDFPSPEPRAGIMTAVARHDDAWAARDHVPFLTQEGKPSAFSRELVGRYSAFEEIDFEDYLAVRGRAAEVVAADNPYAAVVISMHTVSLLTTQADLSDLGARELELHRAFVENQRRLQAELIAMLSRDPAQAKAVEPGPLLRAFEFLQACDSFSLGVCARYPSAKSLRHAHPHRDGGMVEVTCTPLGDDAYRLSPYPLDRDTLILDLPCRTVPGRTFQDQESFRSAYAAAPLGHMKVRIVR